MYDSNKHHQHKHYFWIKQLALGRGAKGKISSKHIKFGRILDLPSPKLISKKKKKKGGLSHESLAHQRAQDSHHRPVSSRWELVVMIGWFRSGHLVFIDDELVNSLLHHHVEFNHMPNSPWSTGDCSSFFPVREENSNDEPNHLVTLSSLHRGNRSSDFKTKEELSGRSGLRSPSPAFTEHQASGSAQHLQTKELQRHELSVQKEIFLVGF